MAEINCRWCGQPIEGDAPYAWRHVDGFGTICKDGMHSAAPDQASTCTCPPDPPYEGPGYPVRLPGKSHKRGCPVVQWIFDSQDEAARIQAEEHVLKGGILPSPGEAEARRAEEGVAALSREVTQLRAEVADLRARIGK